MAVKPWGRDGRCENLADSLSAQVSGGPTHPLIFTLAGDPEDRVLLLNSGTISRRDLVILMGTIRTLLRKKSEVFIELVRKARNDKYVFQNETSEGAFDC